MFDTDQVAVPPPEESARLAGLRYVSEDVPGFTRRRAGRGFAYYDPDGRLERDRAIITRLRSIGAPPAWRDLWYCPYPDGHIQAIARDAKGRRQYRYHPDFRAHRDDVKFDRMPWFGSILPDLRDRFAADLASTSHERRVLAAIATLLDKGSLRIGARIDGEAVGAATLAKDHVDVAGAKVRLHFRGKSGVEQDIAVVDKRVARIVRGLQDLPGQRLFKVKREDGALHTVDSSDVNAYLRDAAGAYLSAKEFRTWAGGAAATAALLEADTPTIKAVLAAAAARLGNTPAVCRRAYVHPKVIEAVTAGAAIAPARAAKGLDVAEATFLRIIADA